MAVGFGDRTTRREGLVFGVVALACMSIAWVMWRHVGGWGVRGDATFELNTPVVHAGEIGADAESAAAPATSPERYVVPVPVPEAPVTKTSRAPSRAELLGWVTDLLDDDVRGNAESACRNLYRAGPAAIPVLQAVVGSSDSQQSWLAECLLRALDAPPTNSLLAKVVEGLGRDLAEKLPYRAHSRTPRVIYLQRHAERARPHLYRGLGSEDATRRFLCAYLLAFSGHADSAGYTCAELIPHLADNHVSADALYAAHALYRLGDAALPAVRRWQRSADGQMLEMLRLIELDITDPPRTRRELERRAAMQSVTTVYFDPAVQFDPARGATLRLR